MFTRRAIKRIVMLALCTLFCVKGVSAQSQFEGNILEYRDVIGIEFLDDPEGLLDINDVTGPGKSNTFRQFLDTSFNYGITQKTIWLRLTIPSEVKNHLRYLEIDNPYIDLVRFYIPIKNNQFTIQQAGDSIPFNERPYSFRTFIFDLDKTSETNENKQYYLQIKSGGNLYFLLNLLSKDSFISYATNSQILIGFYFGLVIIMAFYNLLMFINIREKAYLFYVIYITSFSLFIGSLNGVAFQYLWPTSPYWAQISTVSFSGLVIFTAFMFTREFLLTWKHSPKLDKLIIFFMGLAFTEILISLAREIPVAAKMSIVIGTCLPPIIWLTGLIVWRTGYRPARYFVLAWTIFLISVFISGFTHAGLLPATTLTVYAMQIGSAVEIIMLALALADRMSLLKQDKKKMEKIFLTQLKNNNLSLELQVSARTSELNMAANMANEKAELLEKANIELKELAIRDGLTGLLNHIAFIEQFNHIIEDAKRYEYYISVLLIDIDNFKLINDTHGHLTGNEVLCSVSNIISNGVRESDIAARYGGEEFVIVLSRATMTEAFDKAELIRSKIDNLKFDDIQDLHCTISVGVTTVDWRNKDNNSDKILKKADDAMYKAKKSGKNRICTSDNEFKVVNGDHE
jgi:diguanylate cyclase (GGDEF)-like protein